MIKTEMKQMNALFIHDNIFHETNGLIYSEVGFSRLVWERYLNHFNHLTVIGRGRKQPEKKKWFILSSLEDVDFDLFFSVKGGFDYYRLKKGIERKLAFHILKSDAIIIRLPSTIGFFAAELCKKYNKPYIAEIVGCAWDSSWNYGSLILKIMALYVYSQMYRSVKHSMAAIYVTKYFLQKRYPSYGIQGYASNVQLASVREDVLKRHQQLLCEEKDFVKIGMVANLSVRYKGHDIALKALEKLRKDGLKFKCYFVGGGDQAYVRSLIRKYHLQEEVIIIGPLKEGEEIFSFLDDLDLYIHPSKQEGLPRAVIEAMSRGCPVLASDVAGIPELLDEDYMHHPGNSKILYRQMKKILNDKLQLIEMSEKNFHKSKEYLLPVLKERRDYFFEAVKHKISI